MKRVMLCESQLRAVSGWRRSRRSFLPLSEFRRPRETSHESVEQWSEGGYLTSLRYRTLALCSHFSERRPLPICSCMMELSELLHPYETPRSTKPQGEKTRCGNTRAWLNTVMALPSDSPTTARTTIVPEVTVSASNDNQTEGTTLTAISHQAAPSPIQMTSHSYASPYSTLGTADALTFSPAAHATSAASKNILFQDPSHNTSESSRGALAQQMAKRVPPRKIPVACTRCRSQKRKCVPTEFGARCASCEKRNTQCEYTPVEGLKAYPRRSSGRGHLLTQTTQLENSSTKCPSQSSWGQNLEYQNPMPQPHGPDQGHSWQYVSPSAYSASEPPHDSDQSLANRPSLPSIRDLNLP